MTARILTGDVRDVLATLPEASVQCVITSPPYFGLRDYQVAGQIGLESTLDAYLDTMVAVFDGVRRVMRDDAVLWLNMGDSYNAYNGNAKQGGPVGLTQSVQRPKLPTGAGLTDTRFKPKDLMLVPHRLAMRLQDDGWWVRMDNVWSKPNPMPESVTDRPTRSHEYIFLLTKRASYYYDADAIREPHAEPERGANGLRVQLVDDRPEAGVRNRTLGAIDRDGNQRAYNPAGRNKRSVWTVPTHAFPSAHFATFPPDLIVPCVLAGTSERGACPVCGAPWRRVVERDEHGVRNTSAGGNGQQVHREGASHTLVALPSCTTGWQPTCPHNEPPVPCVVLDPFSGAGTTGVVALRHGRSYIGIELNPEYAEMSRKRIVGDAPLFNVAVVS